MDIVVQTIWKEARGWGFDGMVAMAWVIRNRALDSWKRWSNDPEQVCLERRQFRCWNDTDVERDLWAHHEDKLLVDARYIWNTLLHGNIPDPTNGATHYHNLSHGPSPYDNTPNFVKVMEIHDIIFYRYNP